jgi:hypothetical protein
VVERTEANWNRVSKVELCLLRVCLSIYSLLFNSIDAHALKEADLVFNRLWEFH